MPVGSKQERSQCSQAPKPRWQPPPPQGLVTVQTAVVPEKTKQRQDQTIIKRAPSVLPTGWCQMLEHPGCLDHRV